ncbi:lantibiotic dehydratase [Streptomyces sp. NPDC059679]|uniref:lantibiotic dehydratase n=1 Tax=Streptomyces sp. NPDC059679 TaxID=3346903 RepID=UPI0036C2AD5F
MSSPSDVRIPLGHDSWLIWRDFCVRSAGFPFSQLLETSDSECAALADQFMKDQDSESVFRTHWDAALNRIVGDMLEIVESGGVRQALIWQSPGVLDRAVRWLRQHTPGMTGGGDTKTSARNKYRRKHEISLIKYLQRYHAKNETIGFFGPQAWGSYSPSAERITARTGPELIRDRSIAFEDWAVTALAEAFAADVDIRAHLPPALAAGVRLQGRAVLRPGTATELLDPGLALVAACCDGIRTPRAITAELGWRHGPAQRRSGTSVLADLARLAERNVITWGFDIPLSPSGAASLREQLAGLPASGAGQRALSLLDRLDGVVADLLTRDGDADELRSAFDRLDAIFHEATDRAAYRESGQAARGRRLVFEDCQRDLDVVLGPAFIRDIGPPLGLLLDSARWLVAQLGEAYSAVLNRVVAELAGSSGRIVPLSLILARLIPELERADAEAPVVAEFQNRWRQVLRYEETAARETYAVEDIRGAVSHLFQAPRPSWHSAGYHSPDVMIAADDPAAVQAGDYLMVMGELHVSQTTFTSLSATQWHPDRSDLIAAADEHRHPHPCFIPLYPRGLPDITSRYYPTPELFSERYFYLSFGPRCGARRSPQHRTHDVDGLVVVPSAGGPTVRSAEDARGGADSPGGTPLIEVVAEFLAQRAVNTFRLMPGAEHTPRVTIGRLVAARETWRPRLEGIPIGKGSDDAATFASMRRWAQRLGMPRHVFWRAPWETKPIYLDFDNPLLVGLCATMLRRAAPDDAEQRITVSEMLPTPDQLWLRDAQGRRYTSEVRMVTVDEPRHGEEKAAPHE